jgi:plasmid stabilization system protein ParE
MTAPHPPRSRIFEWAETHEDPRRAASYELGLAGKLKAAAENALCAALRDWSAAHDPAIRAFERRTVRREIARMRKANTSHNAAWRQLLASRDTALTIAAE